MAWIQIAIWVATAAITYAMRPKPEKPRPQAFDASSIPTAEEGKPFPVLFGTRDVAGNVIWYGHIGVVPIKKKGSKK